MPIQPKQQPPYYNTENGITTKTYNVLLSQTGSAPPAVASLLQNTLNGTPTWTYIGVGTYRITLAGAFPLAKTTWTTAITNLSLIMIQSDENDNSLLITTTDLLGAESDELLYYSPIKITVHS